MLLNPMLCSWSRARIQLAINTGLGLVIALVGVYGTHRQSRMILISTAAMALFMIQMVNSQMVSAFCRGQGVTGERWHSRWPDAPADAIFHHQGRLSSHLLPVAFHRM